MRLLPIVLLAVGCDDQGLSGTDGTAPTWTGDDAAARVLEDQVLELVNRQRFTGAVCGSQPFAAAPPLTLQRSHR